ncbi:neurogenic differentiation factor 6-like [Anopheles maculipalpis]|uniref:neurogenic differentiation factor 6-like n=1 Tax=Anopheles maculipalpis TaxID=1496333 RepID=UPI0021597B4B|nr:neurogenic differentiation factor 6-like [Anopheles maculipalpis]
MSPIATPTVGERVRRRRKPTGGGILSLVKRKKANLRERNRMHGLNDALDRLRMCVPLPASVTTAAIRSNSVDHHQQQQQQHGGAPAAGTTTLQKLSKIDTLRLAQNYILVLLEVLHTGRGFKYERLVATLANRLSQNTANLLRTKLSLDQQLQAGLLDGCNEHQEDGFCSTASDNHGQLVSCCFCSHGTVSWSNENGSFRRATNHNQWMAATGYDCTFCGYGNEEDTQPPTCHHHYSPNLHAPREELFDF